MAIMLKTAARFLLLCFLSFGSTLGNTVSVSLSSETGYVGGQLELTCLLNPTAGAIVTSVKWFRGSDTNGIRRNAATCNLVGSAPSYDLNRYSFSCSSNIFKLRISSLESSDGGQCWTCSVTFSNFLETDKASESCIKVQDLILLLLLLLLLLIILVIVILICCGCLDCCKCCRMFDHYDKNKCCYVTCYCLKRGCCSYFCCRAESKRGTFSCCKSEKECCGGCHFFQKKCGCGWPDCCKSEETTSCGGCYCICCVEGLKDEGLDENRSAITGPPAIHTGTQNKVKAETTNKQITSNLHRPSPPLGGEDKNKNRPQPPPPVNNDVKDQNIHGQSAKYDDTTGLTTRSSKLPPIVATK